jgi:deazaflavin-dependent oxidoreductase (nitroreductase family)
MTTTLDPNDFDAAGRPRRSGPVRQLALIFQPLARPFAGSRWFPIWAVLHHTGRRSGTTYATPVVALATDDGFIIPLPFGDRTQWARNLFASGDGRLRYRGRDFAIAAPEVIDAEAAGAWLAAPLRWVSGRLGLRQYVRVRCR